MVVYTAVTILKIDFELATLARTKIEWIILSNQTIDFSGSTETTDNRQ